MDERQLARYLSMGRIVMGVSGVLAPRTFARNIAGPAAADPAGTFVTRSWGVRDAALGFLTLEALDRDDAGGLLRVGVVCDAVDAAAAVLAYRHLRPRMRALVVLTAATATAVGIKLAGALDG